MVAILSVLGGYIVRTRGFIYETNETQLQHFHHPVTRSEKASRGVQINDENISPFYDANVAKYAGKDGRGGLNKADFTTANLKHAINGRLFCNLEGLTMNTDQKIRWHTAVLVGSPPFFPFSRNANDHHVYLRATFSGRWLKSIKLFEQSSARAQLIKQAAVNLIS